MSIKAKKKGGETMGMIKLDAHTIQEIPCDITYETLKVHATDLKYQGCFLFTEIEWKAGKTHQEQVSYVIAIDNRHGECIRGKFQSMESALLWLKHRTLKRNVSHRY